MSTIYGGEHVVAEDLTGDGNVDLALTNNPYMTVVATRAATGYPL
jgi:hypothetical protein